MPTYTCLCCGHTETFETAEEAFDASWDVTPYFTLQPLCDFCPSAPVLIHGLNGARRLHAEEYASWKKHGRPTPIARSPARSRTGTRTEDDSSGKLRRFEREIPDHFGGKSRSTSRALFWATSQRTSLSARPTADSYTWGVSDPADRPWERVCDAEAGSLTPLPCYNTCTRALSGRHKTPPDNDDDDPAKAFLSMHLAGACGL
jgi:hypothetical protein